MYLYLFNVLPGIATFFGVIGSITFVVGFAAFVACRVVCANQQADVNNNDMHSANKAEPWKQLWSALSVFLWVGLVLLLVANLIPSKEFLSERAGIVAKK